MLMSLPHLSAGIYSSFPFDLYQRASHFVVSRDYVLLDQQSDVVIVFCA
jgi:hypothetical protein